MALHWIIAAILIFMLFFGGDLIRSRDGTTLPALHATLGATVLILSIVRLAWRLVSPPPELPATMTGWEKQASKVMAILFYVLMIGLPLTGWLALPSYLARHPALADLTFFGSIPAAGAPSLGFDVGGLHGFMGNVGLALLGLHVLAALKHQFVDHDGILRRMLPL